MPPESKKPADLVGATRAIMRTGDTLTITFEYPIAELEKMMLQGLDSVLRDMARAYLRVEAERLLKTRVAETVAELLNSEQYTQWMRDYAQKYIKDNAAGAISNVVDRTISKALQDLQHRILGRG